jgi:hypothetical protein
MWIAALRRRFSWRKGGENTHRSLPDKADGCLEAVQKERLGHERGQLSCRSFGNCFIIREFFTI